MTLQNAVYLGNSLGFETQPALAECLTLKASALNSITQPDDKTELNFLMHGKNCRDIINSFR